MKPISSSEGLARLISQACAFTASGAAFLAVLVRVLSQWSSWVGGFRPYFVMALHTACMLTVLGAALVIHNRWPGRRGSRIFGGVIVGVITAAGLIAIARKFYPINIEFEAWFVGLAAPAAGSNVGHLSPHTSITFLCAAWALGCLLNVSGVSRWRRRIAFGLASVSFTSGAITTLGFAAGTPLLYGHNYPSMTWLTATIFLALSVGLMLSGFPRNWLLQGLTGETSDTTDVKVSQFRRALVMTLAFLAVGLGAAGFFFLRREQANLRSRVEQELATVADLKINQIAGWRRERLKQAKLLFYTPYAARRALDVIAEPSSQLTRDMFTGWLDPFLETGPYAEALVLDPWLNVVLVHPTRAEVPLSEAERTSAEQALLERQVVVTDLHQPGKNDDTVYLSLMVPIVVRKEGGRRSVPAAGAQPLPDDQSAAVLVLRIDARQTLFPMLKTWPMASLTAETLLVRREGDDCLYLSELRYQTNAALHLRLPLNRTNSPAALAALRKERVLKGRDYRNVPVLAVTRAVPDAPWSIVAKMDEQEVYAPARARGRALSFILGVLLVAVALSLNLLWRRRDVEFLRRQMTTERERFVLAQRLAHVMKHANDIIVMADDQWRIVEVNDRALETYGYSLAEMKQRRGVDLRSPAARAEFRAFDEHFRKHGQVVAETVHIRKDGSTFPVEISTRRIEIDGIPHSLAIIRDITERKRAEELIRQSEEKYRVVFDGAAEGIGVADSQTRTMLYANPAFCAMFGYTNDEVLRLRVDDLHPKESVAQVMLEFEAQARGERKLAVGLPCQRKDGVTFHADVSAKPAVISGRRVIVGFFTDITERKKAELALRESEERYRLLFEGITDGVFVYGITEDDLPGQILAVNDTICQRLGYSRKELLKRKVLDIIAPESPVNWPEVVAKIKRGEKALFEQFHVTKNGRRIPVEINAQSFQVQGRPVVLSVVRDVTERKQTEEYLHRQAALLDATNDAIYVRALDHTITFWNEGAARLYGWSRAEALGRKITELSGKDRPAFEAAHAALLKQGAWSGELKQTNQAGNDIVVFCRWTLLCYEDGRPKEILAINSDITEKKKLETQFLRAQRLEGVGALAGGIAHDLNNILAPILMSASLLRETLTDPESRSILATVTACAQRGADIIKQLLTFARGKPSARVPMPVRHLLNDMEKIIRETFPRNIQPAIKSPEDLWPVLGDPTQIHQALMNLCVNARDAMLDGGTLTVTAANLSLDARLAAEIPDAKPGSYVCVSVVDTGTGISPENLDRIFDPFFTTKEVGKGTGLGLPTVLGIVRGHDGFVRVNSRVGQGTTVEIYLRASPEATVVRASDTEILPPRGRGELVLVVDDEASVRSIVQRTLESHGYRVLSAAEGNEALKLFAQYDGEIKLVLTDMMMPGMEGPALVRALRNLSPRLPIIGMTGLAQQAGVQGVESLNLPVLLTKPFNGAKLLLAIHETLANETERRTALVTGSS